MNVQRMLLRFAILAVLLLAPASAQQPTQEVLIRASKPYGSLINSIQSRGGVVTHQFKYVDAVAAQIPVTAVAALISMLPAGALSKDVIIAAPSPVNLTRSDTLPQSGDETNLAADAVEALGDADLSALALASPNAYLVNNAIMNVSPLHAGGTLGTGVIVAVIDSGIRPGFPHITLDGSVIGGEDFVGDGLGFSNFANNPHGTFVAGMISANVSFTFAASSTIRAAVLAEAPGAFSNPPTNTIIPMIGTAPRSSIYALRVFAPTGGAPTSRVLAAVERAIELREKFDAGAAGGVNIQVCNMSLGGSTLFPGRDLMDTAIDQMLARGIVPVISAGNSGPSSLTVGSPGTSVSAITVGAASQAWNERIVRRLQFGPVNGALYRPSLGTQMAYFSSRGPNADGRVDPDVVTNGVFSFGQGYAATTSGITFASGTSFSAPSVAGVAALLRQKYPAATALQIRNAIVLSANPGLFADQSTELDQGNGYVDALAASDLLATGDAPDTAPVVGRANQSVKVNIETGSALDVRDGPVQESFRNLLPAQRHDILYRVSPNTKQVVVTLANVTPTLPPAQQNQLFGDDVLFTVHSAKTSAVDDYKVQVFTLGGTFTIDAPELGIMRITVNGDWTNAGTISGDVTISATTDPSPQFTSQGKIANGESIVVPVRVPAGVASLDFSLGWREDWSSFPTSDIDLILIAPNGATNTTGAALNNPERVTIAKPQAGTWQAVIVGGDIPAGQDKYELRVAADGKVLR